MSTEFLPLALSLTEAMSSRLLEDKTAGDAVDMSERIASAYGNRVLSPAERQSAEHIFRLMLRDTELRVRVSLAQNLKESNEVPRDIVMTLAKDVEEVSLPVLQYSEVLERP